MMLDRQSQNQQSPIQQQQQQLQHIQPQQPQIQQPLKHHNIPQAVLQQNTIHSLQMQHMQPRPTLIQKKVLNTPPPQPQQVQHIHPPKPASPVTPKDPPPKIISNFYALCAFCGVTGVNHAQCDRCRRIFTEEPKRIAISTKTIVKNLEKEKKKEIMIQVIPKTKSAPVTPMNPIVTEAITRAVSVRGTGTITRGSARGRGGRGRGRGRTADVEPVVLTLSSDEEEENEKSSSQDSRVPNLPSPTENEPFSFEPPITEEDTVSSGEFFFSFVYLFCCFKSRYLKKFIRSLKFL